MKPKNIFSFAQLQLQTTLSFYQSYKQKRMENKENRSSGLWKRHFKNIVWSDMTTTMKKPQNNGFKSIFTDMTKRILITAMLTVES